MKLGGVTCLMHVFRRRTVALLARAFVLFLALHDTHVCAHVATLAGLHPVQLVLGQVVSARNASASERGGGRSCDRMNSLKPWQSDAQGVMGARTTVYYAMGLHKAGTSLMGAALAARLGGGYENEAVYHCCTRCKQKCAVCDTEGLSSDAYPTVPHFFMKSIDSYFCQCGHVMVRLRPCIERVP